MIPSFQVKKKMLEAFKDMLRLRLTRAPSERKNNPVNNRGVERKPAVKRIKKLIVPVTCIKYRKANTEHLDSQDSCYTLESKDVWGHLLHQITVTRSIKKQRGEEKRHIYPPIASLHKRIDGHD